MSPRARTQSRRHAVVASALLVLGLGAALSVSVALGDGSARAAVTPDDWAPILPNASGVGPGETPDEADASDDAEAPDEGEAADEDAVDRAIPNHRLDSLTPDQLHNRIEALGWIFVGKGRHSETPEANSVTWVVAHPPGIDAVVTLYRFESQDYLETVRPFVEAQDEVQIARGERTLLYTRIRKNPEAARALLAELQQP